MHRYNKRQRPSWWWTSERYKWSHLTRVDPMAETQPTSTRQMWWLILTEGALLFQSDVMCKGSIDLWKKLVLTIALITSCIAFYMLHKQAYKLTYKWKHKDISETKNLTSLQLWTKLIYVNWIHKVVTSENNGVNMQSSSSKRYAENPLLITK